MNSYIPKIRMILLLSAVILLCFLGAVPGLIVGSVVAIIVFSTDRKCIKMFLNPGFLIFLVIAAGVPLISRFSIAELEDNVYILLRGVLVFLLLHFYSRAFRSSSAYELLRRTLPQDMIELVQLSVDILPEMQREAGEEFGKLKKFKKFSAEPVADMVFAMIKSAERLMKNK